MAGIYALEIIEEKLEQKYLTNQNLELEENKMANNNQNFNQYTDINSTRNSQSKWAKYKPKSIYQ